MNDFRFKSKPLTSFLGLSALLMVFISLLGLVIDGKVTKAVYLGPFFQHPVRYLHSNSILILYFEAIPLVFPLLIFQEPSMH